MIFDQFYETAGQRLAAEDVYNRIFRSNRELLVIWSKGSKLICDYVSLAISGGHPGVAKVYRDYHVLFEERIERRLASMMQQGVVSAGDPHVLTLALTGMLESFAIRLFATSGRELPLSESETDSAAHMISSAWYRQIFGVSPAPASIAPGNAGT
jgi:hypothetical protein